MLVLYQFVIAYQYSRPSLRNITDAEYARSISDSTHIPTAHSGTEPGPHGFGLGFCAAALMILYVLVLVVCHMTDNKCMISVTETIRDTVAYKKIDFFKRTPSGGFRGGMGGMHPPHQPKLNESGRKIALNFGEDLFFFFLFLETT